jgi:hypothetical protein
MARVLGCNDVQAQRKNKEGGSDRRRLLDCYSEITEDMVDYFSESGRIEAEGSDSRSSYDQITGTFFDYNAPACPPDEVVIVTGSRQLPQDLSGGWYGFAPDPYYNHLTEPVFSMGINPRDFVLITAAVGTASIPKVPTPAGVGINVILGGAAIFSAMIDRSRAGFIDLSSLAVP